MKTVDFAYDIGDPVEIIGTGGRSHKGVEGRVIAMCFDKQGIGYRIAYWNEGKRYDEWMFDWELT